MDKKTAIEYLKLVIKDCKNGYENSQDWNEDGWDAMVDLLVQVKNFISSKKELE